MHCFCCLSSVLICSQENCWKEKKNLIIEQIIWFYFDNFIYGIFSILRPNPKYSCVCVCAAFFLCRWAFRQLLEDLGCNVDFILFIKLCVFFVVFFLSSPISLSIPLFQIILCRLVQCASSHLLEEIMNV